MNYCLECGKKILGRSDKKFCSDICRTNYNNRKYRKKNSYIYSINKKLKKNHSILNEFINNNNKRCTYTDLYSAGFDFNYFTSILNNKIMCYNLGYTISRKGIINIFAKIEKE
ncbi:MAG: hypothetical protein WCS34_05795 [Bacteroidales bacterium]